MAQETRTILVFGEKTFRIRIAPDDKLTFGPFSPPSDKYSGERRNNVGTLRVYKDGSKENCIGVFTGVSGFREESLAYEEKVAQEEGAILWNSDKDGYTREERVTRSEDWEKTPALSAGAGGKKAKR